MMGTYMAALPDCQRAGFHVSPPRTFLRGREEGQVRGRVFACIDSHAYQPPALVVVVGEIIVALVFRVMFKQHISSIYKEEST